MPGSAERLLLDEALNVAVILARDAVYCPPGFLLEDPLVRKVISERPAFREARILRLPVRETLDELWAKKENEYATIRDSYEGLFDVEGRKFVEENARLLIERPFQVSNNLVARWEDAPDKTGTWSAAYIRNFPAGIVEIFRRVPRSLADDGQAVTWESISRRVREIALRHPRYRALVQHIYFGLYVELLDLEVMTSVPGYRQDFGLGGGSLAYSYQSFFEVCQAAGTWTAFLGLDELDVLALRRTVGYFDFRRAYFQLCATCSTHIEFREALARGADLRAVDLVHGEQRWVHRGQREAKQPSLFESDPEHVEVFATRLAAVCEGGVEAVQEQRESTVRSANRLRKLRMMRSGTGEAKPRLAIFAPLPEERDILIRRLGLEALKAPYRWEGGTDSAAILLYSAPFMGRVPAAVATSRILADEEGFDAFVVVGFAGGFAESRVKQGDVLVPSVIADLAARKIRTADDRPVHSIRPVPYPVNGELQGYLESHFDQGAWAMKLATEAGWPAGTHPLIKCGKPIVCGDEVVASDLHRSDLLDAWPEATGVEMESGGVFAAVEVLAPKDVLKCTVRVVTDMADPGKSDDIWRRRGAEALSSLITEIDWSEVVKRERR